MGESNCTLVGLVGILIQLSLGALSFSVLLIKRWREKPKRPWRIWMLDTSKQVISQLIAHFINLTISIAMSYEAQDSDACIWYFVTNIFDNTFGVLVCVLVLKLVHKLLKRKGKKQYISGNYHRKELQIISQAKSKNYSDQSEANHQNSMKRESSQISDSGKASQAQDLNSMPIEIQMQVQHTKEPQNISSPANIFKDFKQFTFDQQNTHQQPMIDKERQVSVPGDSFKTNQIQNSKQQAQTVKTRIIIDYKAWIIQLLIWNAIVAIVKSAIFGIQFGLKGPLMVAGTFAVGWTQAYPVLELLLVIVIVPVIMNGLAFWVQDNFLMKKATQSQQENLLEQSHKEGQKNGEDIIVQEVAQQISQN